MGLLQLSNQFQHAASQRRRTDVEAFLQACVIPFFELAQQVRNRSMLDPKLYDPLRATGSQTMQRHMRRHEYDIAHLEKIHGIVIGSQASSSMKRQWAQCQDQPVRIR